MNDELNKSLEIIDRYVIRSSTDIDGVITDVSEAFCKISGYKREELIGKPHSIVRHPDMESKVFQEMWKTILAGNTWSGNVKNRTKSGGFYWVQAFIEPNFDHENNIVGFAAVRIDITNKILLEDQMKKNDAIITFADSGIGTIDLNGNFLSTNHVYEELFGYSLEELSGKNCLELVTKEYFDDMKNALEEANKDGVVSHLEIACLNKSKKKISMELSLNKLPDNKSFVVVINSLEDKKRLEQTNEILNQKVQEEVRKNTEQMKIIQEEKIKNAKSRSIGALAAGITHEINTPLTYIKGNFELMQFDIEDLPSGNIKQRMENSSQKILGGINRIANIIQAMREVSQVSSELKKVNNIYNTILTSLTIVQGASKAKSKIYINGMLFSPEMEKDLFDFESNVQRQRIEQVWIVITNNALDELVKVEDYEKRALNITLKETKDSVTVAFSDNAGGIPPEMIKKIFDPFVSTKESGGIGVGLHIAKKIIDEQDGKILVYNKDEGAVFEVILPKANQEEQ